MVSSPHILVVDDDREIRDLLGRFLGKHGYRGPPRPTAAKRPRSCHWAIDLDRAGLMLAGRGWAHRCAATWLVVPTCR